MQDVFDRDDDLDIPDPGYDVPRRRAGGSNRRLALIATAIGVSLVAVGGGLELASRRSTTVPVIAADSRPIRVRPENPGGMQVIGANESLASDQGAEALAPPPEAPDTRALRAQQQAELAARTPVPAAPSAAALSRPGSAALDVPLPPQGNAAAQDQQPIQPRVTAAPPAAAPRTIAPAPVHAAVTAPPPAPTTQPTAPAGHRVVQLAAVASEEAATAEWDRLAKRMPDLLGGRRPEIVRFEHEGHVFWRLRTAGFADSTDAGAFCSRVRAKGANCAVF